VVLSGAEGKHDHRPWRRCCRVPSPYRLCRQLHEAGDVLRCNLHSTCRPKCVDAKQSEIFVEVAETWRDHDRLDPEGLNEATLGKAPVDTPQRAMGGLLGHAVRFGAADDVLAVGEGIETMLSLRCALPAMPMAAALSANHLAALLLPPTLRRLYIARDADAAGEAALAALTGRADAAGIEAFALSPQTGDFNEDLRAFGLGALRTALRIQLAAQDIVRFRRKGMAKTR